MYRRSIALLTTMAALAGVATLTSLTAHSQGGVKNLVFLQPTTPGVAQSGHANLSGVVRASQFVGGGAGLNNLDASSIASGTLSAARLPVGVAFLTATQSWSGTNFFTGNTTFAASGAPFAVGNSNLVTNLNADLLDGLSSSAFLQSVPVPLNLSGTNVGGSIVSASNAATSVGSRGVSGFVTGATGDTSGVHGQNTSSSGKGVSGIALSTSGATYGVHGTANSTVGTGVFGTATSTTGPSIGIGGQSASSSGYGSYGFASAVSGNTYGVYGAAQSATGIGVYGEIFSATGANYGLYGKVLSPSGTGVFGQNTSSTGSAYGVRGETFSTSGIALFGASIATSGSTRGVVAQVESSGGIALVAESLSTAGGAAIKAVSNASTTSLTATLSSINTFSGSATALAGYFESSGTSETVRITNERTTGTTTGLEVNAESPGGTGILAYGSTALSAIVTADFTTGTALSATNLSGNGIGVDVFINAPTGFGIDVRNGATSGDAIGARIMSSGDDGIAVYGEVDSTFGSGAGIGGYFVTDGNTGRGVFGENPSTGGIGFGVYGQSASSLGRGVLGNATAIGALDTPYGVRGTASTATLGFAVFAAGDMGASGVKPFRIDHPLDPENMYLLHYSAESPFPQNFYNGTVVTDSKGYAWIDLPNYFGEINTNFKYQLTVVDEEDSDDFVLAKVTKKIKANRFQIRTSKPNVEVSWEVKADRNDLRVRANRPTDERPKVGLEKGKYQHPEYYGAPKTSGMDYIAPRPKPIRSQSKH